MNDSSSSEQFPFNKAFAWHPSDEYLQRSRLRRFMLRYGLESFEALMERSTREIAWFWETVHTHCGFPIKSAQDMAHGFDIQETDTMFWLTDMGWMLGPWEVFGMLRMGRSLAPKEIRIVGDIPKTRNAKVMRRVMRSVYLGLDPGDLSALVNPQSIDGLRQTK